MKKFILFLALLLPAFCLAQDVPYRTAIEWAYDDDTGGFSVDVQDQTTPPIEFFFALAQGQTTLAAVTAVDDRTLTLTDATGFTDGTYILVRQATVGDSITYYIGTQVGAAVGNVITVDSPLSAAFAVGDNVYRGTNNMAVDGSSTPVVFEVFGPRVGSFDIVRLMIKMLTDSAVSLDKFGDIPALTNGLVLRTLQDGVYRNIWNVKRNADLALITFDYNPFASTNPNQGQDGAFFRNTFSGQDKHGVAIRLTGENNKVQLIVQDDLRGILELKTLIEGHEVKNGGY